MLHAAALAALRAAGCEITDFGVCPRPVLQFETPRRAAAGAVMISGGHNGPGWNALTLIGADGALLEPYGGEAVLDLFHAGVFRQADWRHQGRVEAPESVTEPYLQALAETLDVAAIRAAEFTVLIDPVGGAACGILPELADRLGFNLVPINAAPSGYLAREAEPRPRSARQMASIITPLKGDAGFILSSDAGRVSLVTEDGEPVSEEMTFTLAAQQVLSRRPGPVVTNICTTRAVDDLAARSGVPLLKTRVGEAYVMSALQDEEAVLAGEGSGGVALAAFSNAFDALLTLGIILEAMAQQGRTLSALLKAVPRYHIVKRQIYCESGRGYHALESAANRLAGLFGTPDQTDGLRFELGDGWLHVRMSRTEKTIRIISEAREAAVAERRAEEVIREINQDI
jgi:phosphomannomutase